MLLYTCALQDIIYQTKKGGIITNYISDGRHIVRSDQSQLRLSSWSLHVQLIGVYVYIKLQIIGLNHNPPCWMQRHTRGLALETKVHDVNPRWLLCDKGEWRMTKNKVQKVLQFYTKTNRKYGRTCI